MDSDLWVIFTLWSNEIGDKCINFDTMCNEIIACVFMKGRKFFIVLIERLTYNVLS